MDLAESRMVVEPYFEKLTAFESADQIRDFLVAEGIKANKGRSTSCAIAEYVHCNSGERVHIGTDRLGIFHDGGDIAFWTADPSADSLVSTAYSVVRDHTAAMIAFIINFDLGKYPELVAE